ncbi:hypothetical protein Acsp04_38160 [Actinomadura sp. NBRC 104425]|uniref:hypothetical protein n=1 Tax=Actinomadura sp. NBRC 104425 TaxID=3032204 RepID=UPI0024A492C8|nr:hypothetical protein [Actinomadura sp. NBRC 104425]GLZ13581.1 hypothetical protein Acsp04_38160 [Actinomadura sp. NBRC 104425]
MVSDERVGYLRELEQELDTRGLVARVVHTRSGPAFLRVVNPEAASLAEDITCAPAPESPDHYYWWSWGERMHRVDDPSGAAVKLERVLQPLPEETRRETHGKTGDESCVQTRDPEGQGLRGRGPDPAGKWPNRHA